jgi:putative hemolysin
LLTDAIFSAGIIAAEFVLLGLYAALCTEIPRRAAKTGSLSGDKGESFAKRTFGYLRFMLGLFAPVILCGRLGTAVFGKIYSIRPESEDDNGEELIQLIGEENENGGIEDAEAEMISNIFEFTDLDLHEVMTHRTEICGVELTAPVGEAVKLSVERGFSRLPVYRETIDDICGVLYIKDLLPLVNENNTSEHFVSEYLRKIKYVPETAGCGELFRWFTENKRQIAVVLDEYGGTAGIVTMEDLLECIVGNIRDEYDGDEQEEIQEITPNTFDILGSADPDEAMERLGCPLEEEHDFDTMGGFVISLLGYIPESGRTPSVRYRDITFNVISAKDNRIERIRALIDKKRVTADEEK